MKNPTTSNDIKNEGFINSVLLDFNSDDQLDISKYVDKSNDHLVKFHRDKKNTVSIKQPDGDERNFRMLVSDVENPTGFKGRAFIELEDDNSFSGKLKLTFPGFEDSYRDVVAAFVTGSGFSSPQVVAISDFLDKVSENLENIGIGESVTHVSITSHSLGAQNSIAAQKHLLSKESDIKIGLNDVDNMLIDPYASWRGVRRQSREMVEDALERKENGSPLSAIDKVIIEAGEKELKFINEMQNYRQNKAESGVFAKIKTPVVQAMKYFEDNKVAGLGGTADKAVERAQKIVAAQILLRDTSSISVDPPTIVQFYPDGLKTVGSKSAIGASAYLLRDEDNAVGSKTYQQERVDLIENHRAYSIAKALSHDKSSLVEMKNGNRVKAEQIIDANKEMKLLLWPKILFKQAERFVRHFSPRSIEMRKLAEKEKENKRLDPITKVRVGLSETIEISAHIIKEMLGESGELKWPESAQRLVEKTDHRIREKERIAHEAAIRKARDEIQREKENKENPAENGNSITRTIKEVIANNLPEKPKTFEEKVSAEYASSDDKDSFRTK